MSRHRQHEKLSQAVRAELPSVAVPWLAAVRRPLERLTMAALDPGVSDADFRRLVEEFSESLPGLLDEIDHDALGKLMEDGMGAAMANGIAARVTPERQAKNSTSRPTPEEIEARGADACPLFPASLALRPKRIPALGPRPYPTTARPPCQTEPSP